METPEKLIQRISSSSSSSVATLSGPAIVHQKVMSLRDIDQSPPVLASPINLTHPARSQHSLITDEEMNIDTLVVADKSDSEQTDTDDRSGDITTEWLGSSQFFFETCLELQQEKVNNVHNIPNLS